MKPTIGRIFIYAKDVESVASFYAGNFGFKILRSEGDRIVELVASSGGVNIMLHPAAKSKVEGQTSVKIVFDVKDVESFKAKSAKKGLKFGVTHKADGYVYSNAKDPSKNSIQISSRAFR